MSVQLSRDTILINIPIIKAVCADLEVRLLAPEAVNRRTRIGFLRLGEPRDVSNAMQVIKIWILDTAFSVDNHELVKPPEADWQQLLDIIRIKMLPYKSSSDGNITTLTLKGNRLIRIYGKDELSYDFTDNGHKIQAIKLLPRDGTFMTIKQINIWIGADSEKSLAKTIKKINDNVRKPLGLPMDKDFIEIIKGSGYRINPEWYELIILS